MTKEKRWADIIKMCGVLGKACTFRNCTAEGGGTYLGVSVGSSQGMHVEQAHKELLFETERRAERLKEVSAETMVDLVSVEAVLKEVRKR